ncbi:hypothetical protein [Psychrobacter cibarius]|uniref:hypothetical protein n=1 Tax=Psychrobacter cibarius TaxID=282669 RepID=UPI00191B57E8|nr:hypothetical protein [Psychrobacter cibarius]
MSNIGWGIIGVPDGFQHISQGITANKNINTVDNRVCSEEYAENTVSAVIYDTAIVEGTNTRQLMTYFVEYRFAKELEKERPGSFYGSYISLSGVVPDSVECCKVIVKLLKELSEYNKGFFISDDKKFKKEYTDSSKDYDLNSSIFKEGIDLINSLLNKAKIPTKKIDNKKVL